MGAQKLFITGTDTGVGKTRVAATLLRVLAARGARAVGMKPVASGAEPGQQNEDVAALVAASSVKAPLEWVNPYCFAPPIAPHLAAREAGVSVSIPRLVAACQALGQQADWVVVEGAGGLCVPLDGRHDFRDLVRALGAPVLLVVGLRLGCINHAVLTAEAIRAAGLPWTGWVANQIDPAMLRAGDNLETLRALLPEPFLGICPWQCREDGWLDLAALKISRSE